MNNYTIIYTRIKDGKYEKNSSLFKDDLFEVYNIQEHPKAQALFDKAWDYGHSSGYYEVLHVFDYLVELIQ
jgi:hypothetical protein